MLDAHDHSAKVRNFFVDDIEDEEQIFNESNETFTVEILLH